MYYKIETQKLENEVCVYLKFCYNVLRWNRYINLQKMFLIKNLVSHESKDIYSCILDSDNNSDLI